MKFNVWYLARERFSTLWFHMGRIITSVVFLIIFIVLNEISTMFLKDNMQPWMSNVFIICASAVFGILMVTLSMMMFRGEFKSNQIGLELREGYKPRQIYIARIFEMIFYFGVFMIIALIVNLATISATGHMDNVMWYHMFVTSLGWYAIIGIIGMGMGIFFAGFLNSGWAGTLASAVVLIVILVGSFIAGVVAVSSNKTKNNNLDYTATLANKKIDNAAINFAENDLGIHNPEEWLNVLGDFVSFKDGQAPWDSTTNNNGQGGTSTGPATAWIDSSNYISVKDPTSNTIDELFWQKYYSMITGDWSWNTTEFANTNNDSWSNRINHKTNSDYANLAGAFGGLGVGILQDSSEMPSQLVKFFDASHNFFNSNFKSFKYKDIENWDMLSGKAEGYTQWGNKTVHTGKHYSTENYKGMMDKISKDSAFTKNYSFIKEMAEVSDASALSSMSNNDSAGTNSYRMYGGGSSNGIPYSSHVDNLDNGASLYPVFATGGNYYEQPNIQPEFEEVLTQKKMTPAEFVFNRNVIYYVTKAFIDMNAYSQWTPGRTILASGAKYLPKQNKVILYVNNAKPFNYGNVAYDKTSLEYGKLAQDALAGLTINFNGTTVSGSDIKNAEFKTSYSYKPYNFGRETVDNYVITFDLKNNGISNGSDNTINGHVTSLNPSFMISDSMSDLEQIGCIPENMWYGHGNNNGNNEDNSFEDNNAWLDNEQSKAIISSMNFDKKNNVMNIYSWDGESDLDLSNVLSNVEFKDNGGKLTATTSAIDGGVQVSFNRQVSGTVNVSFKKAVDDINTNLIDGSFFLPLTSYKKTEAHASALSLIYNPLTQLQAMFNGVNYRSTAMDNMMTSYLNQYYVGINACNLRVSLATSTTNPYANQMKMQRANYVEVVYIYYVLVEALFVFVGFWMYRKSIVA